MTIPLSEAKSRLDELVAQLGPGEELVLTDSANRPVARLVGESQSPPGRYRDFPKLRHYSAATVCLASAGIATAGFGLAGWEPLVGFVLGLVVTMLLVSAAFAVAHTEGD